MIVERDDLSPDSRLNSSALASCEHDEPRKPPPQDYLEVEGCENCGELDCECDWEDEAYDLAGDR